MRQFQIFGAYPEPAVAASWILQSHVGSRKCGKRIAMNFLNRSLSSFGSAQQADRIQQPLRETQKKRDYEMPRAKGDGSKSSKRIKLGKPIELTNKDWNDLEALFQSSLTGEVRAKVELATSAFATIGKNHSREDTVSSKKAIAALNTWIKASGRYRISLREKSSIAESDRTSIIAKFRDLGTGKQLEKLPPLRLFDVILNLAIGAAQAAIAEIPRREFGPDVKGDLWLAWVALIALAVKQAGVKTTASSSHVARQTPFVKGILLLQSLLPEYCRRFSTYDAVVKGVHLSRKRFRNADEVSLNVVMMATGSGIIGNESVNELSDLIRENKTAY
jgi:hypothetical protein